MFSRSVRCAVVGGSLVGLSAAIALSRLGFDVAVAERSPARAVDGGGGLGVDVALLCQVTGIAEEPPVRHIRVGSMKRVAAAVGDGSSAIR